MMKKSAFAFAFALLLISSCVDPNFKKPEGVWRCESLGIDIDFSAGCEPNEIDENIPNGFWQSENMKLYCCIVTPPPQLIVLSFEKRKKGFSNPLAQGRYRLKKQEMIVSDVVSGEKIVFLKMG